MDTSRRIFLLLYITLALVNLSLFLLLLAIYFPSSIFAYFATVVFANFPGFIVACFVISIPVWRLMLNKRSHFILGWDFQTVHNIQEKTARLAPVLFISLLLFAGILMLSMYALKSLPLALVILSITYILLEILVVTVLIELYFAGAFYLERLIVLCFRQARELKYPISKLKWIRNALKHIRERASKFNLELDSSELERYFAARLFEDKAVNKELNLVSSSFWACNLTLAMEKLKIDLKLSIRKGLKERLSAYSKSKIMEISGLILYLIVLLIYLYLGRMPPFLSL